MLGYVIDGLLLKLLLINFEDSLTLFYIFCNISRVFPFYGILFSRISINMENIIFWLCFVFGMCECDLVQGKFFRFSFREILLRRVYNKLILMRFKLNSFRPCPCEFRLNFYIMQKCQLLFFMCNRFFILNLVIIIMYWVLSFDCGWCGYFHWLE